MAVLSNRKRGFPRRKTLEYLWDFLEFPWTNSVLFFHQTPAILSLENVDIASREFGEITGEIPAESARQVRETFDLDSSRFGSENGAVFYPFCVVENRKENQIELSF